MFRRTVHPGEILKDELGITLTEFARQIDVPATMSVRSSPASAR